MGVSSSKDGHDAERARNDRGGHGQREDEDSIPSRGVGRGQMTINQTSDRPVQLRPIDVIDINPQAPMSEIGPAESSIPTVFKWEHGGRHVYIAGTFNNWAKQLPMHRSGNDFTYVHNLSRGKHAFKFIVDDEWRFAPDQPTIADIEGRINNFIDVSDFTPYTGDENFFEKSKDRKVPEQEFRQNIPDLDDYTKE